MPLYCFETPDGKIIERSFPMGSVPRRVKILGTWARRNIAAEHCGRSRSKCNPWEGGLHSEAAAVHPSQVAMAEEGCKIQGVPTKYDHHGRPIWTSAKHKRQHIKLCGFYSRNDYY